MRCIFCKGESSASRSVEHIIPESLGNLDHVLQPGVVCDVCNNYFAREVEKPFLECSPIAHLRFEQGLPNKRGRVPPVKGVVTPGPFSVTLVQEPHPDPTMSWVFSPEAAEAFHRVTKGTLWYPGSSDDLPQGPVVSRFMAKVALEVVAARFGKSPQDLEALVDEKEFDPIRDHARRGGSLVNWPVSVRRIYPADRLWGEEKYQLVHEFDILITERSEWYFVLAVFGLELVINYEGPEIDGYYRWLSENGGESPLYMGRNVPPSGPSSSM
jgi:hypothetical protein